MTRFFFDTIVGIDQILEKWMAARVKLAFNLAEVQQDLLEELGYKNLAPLHVYYETL